MELVLVAVIVVLAFAYATWTMVPGALRTRIAVVVTGLCRRAGWEGAGAARLVERISASPGCTSCESCKGCQAGIRSSVDSMRIFRQQAQLSSRRPQ